MQLVTRLFFVHLKPKLFSAIIIVIFAVSSALAQPANDNCASASIVTISGSGYGLGTFTSTQDDMTAATLQTGETFAASINTAGLNKKSVWYKFTLPTTRGVRISLLQPGSAIQAGNVGFAVYKTNTCVPPGSDISSKLTPIETFGNTYHPCVANGDYYIQVSGNNLANGLIYITVETSYTTGAFDRPAQAFNFGTITTLYYQPDFTVDCYSTEDATEVCTALSNYQDYNKSSWHVFTTPAYFDYIAITEGINLGVKFGIKIYQGDVRTSPYGSLPVVLNCDSLENTIGGTLASKIFGCNELSPNTTYSIQLFYHKNFTGQIGLKLEIEGSAPTKAPEPILSAIAPTTNNMGVLASAPNGIGTTRTDVLACNSRHSLHPCSPALPASGVLVNGRSYNLSTFFTFTLSGTSSISVGASGAFGSHNGACGTPFYLRLYKQGVSNNCNSLDTVNIIGAFFTGREFVCLPAGNYTLQVMGQDTTILSSYPYCQKSNLGTKVFLDINVKSQFAENRFSLSAPGKYEAVNVNAGGVMQPLVSHVKYNMVADTMGCANTVLPDTTCDNSTKGSFHEFIVADSGSLNTTSWTQFRTRVYRGDANALATVQNKFTYPEKITGMPPVSHCIGNPGSSHPGVESDIFCVTPGTYTMVSIANLRDPYNQVSIPRDMSVTLRATKPKYDSPAKAENMGDLWAVLGAGGGIFTSQRDTFTCYDNPATIDGLAPCLSDGGYNIVASKLAYRQFYLSKSSLVTIETTSKSRLFSGKATDGLAGLRLVSNVWDCFTSVGSDCLELPTGWYTVVTYGWGANFARPIEPFLYLPNNIHSINGVKITLKLPLCVGPSFNRPYKAAIDPITQQPFLIQWAPRVGHTAAYPKTDTTYTLPTETFGCANDTPFISHPVAACGPLSAKVAYWVFKITQESFVSVLTENYWHGWTNYFGYSVMVYAGNARKDSALFATAQPIQPCLQSLGHTQLSKLQPGEYTLVIFAPGDAVCKTVTPKIYIDQVGYSRFDHASNAYDFGQIKPDSTWYNGKPGDVNPLNPGRAPSNDFFYCTTGAQPTDPLHGCSSIVLPSIYNPGNNVPLFTSNHFPGYPYLNYPIQPARNLWYTFTVNHGGQVRVRVKNKTIQRGWQYNYSVFKSNVDGSLPFSTVVSSGGVDSVTAQGLQGIVTNTNNFTLCAGNEEVSFTRDACSPIPERYYIVVSSSLPSNGSPSYNAEWMYPNHQVEVEVLFDSVNAVLPKFDHYYQANNIGTNLGPGTYTGATDNNTCATRDAPEPNPLVCSEIKSVWYKFSTTVSGSINYGMQHVTGASFIYGNGYAQLYREIIPGDSTSNGLQFMEGKFASDAIQSTWQNCITPGTYYLLLPNCGNANGYIYPKIILSELAGDYCVRPVISNITGAGNKITSAVINCHTIGTDYGEFNATLTCPPNAITKNYKTTWYRLDITGTDTLDITVFLNENTNYSSTDIKYRMMTGNCNAMQEQSCVQDALTRNTYKCLAPGKSYYIQVFSPLAADGIIDLNVSAVVHADSCQPQPPCIAVANFSAQFDCTINQNVTFINSSTYGTSIQYDWSFGYNNQTSSTVVPQFYYPALTTAATYTIRLIVTNTDCGKKDTAYQTITIPARAVLNLGNDTTLCNGGTVLLNATSYTGSTYQWNTGANTPTILAAAAGQNNYSVMVTYNGCISRDTIRVNIDPINPVTHYKYVCGTDPIVLNASRGFGESHSWSTGATTASINVFAPGIYWVDMQLRGCTTRDSFIVSRTALALGNDRQACFGTQPVILNATTIGATGYTWQNGSTNATFTAPSAGLYWVDIAFANCTLRDTILLTNIQPQTGNINASICQGQTYTLPSGKLVSAAGIYTDTLRTTGGCDSLINTVNLQLQNITTVTTNAAVCAGQSYTLPWGTVVNAAGIYRDTLRYQISGCDSVRRTINLAVQTTSATTINAAICVGQTYTLPWGTVVNTAGIYRDTLRYAVTGCDSLQRTINLAVQSSVSTTINATICFGQTYTLPWGRVVNTAGVYTDTLRYSITNCDSVKLTVNLAVQKPDSTIANVAICSGQTYTLPWGNVVNASGMYRDTARYTVTNCDSLYRVVNLTVQLAPSTTTNATICTGQTYSLPSGIVVNASGIYRDTLKYINSGCDSIYRVVNLTVKPLLSINTNATICFGQTYTLPWGTLVNTTGVYGDTLRYTTTGCDSVRRVVNVVVQSPVDVTTNASLCAGQNYTLPWGAVVNTAGIYRDTLRFSVTGCDSVRRAINLAVQPPDAIITNAAICFGQSYTLPWGTVVNTAGVYRDTLRYTTGDCDSIRRTVNLSIQTAVATSTNATICFGQNYTLPWGAVVNTAGIYGDTLRYTITACDSVRRAVNLAVQKPDSIVTNAAICSGQTYTLPWGNVVNASGMYRDTSRYIVTNCDSVYRVVHLTVQSAPSATTNATICAGQTFSLPSGIVVNTSGIYRDTLKHLNSGCDSIYRVVNLTVKPLLSFNTNATICFGQTYTLPWGTVVNVAGVYGDTIRYSVSGCDSLRRVVNLTVQSPATIALNASICSGQSYTLPWGIVVNTSGIYRDTLQYINTGCDSVRRTVNLVVQAPAVTTTDAIICAGQSYILPSGNIVTTAGIYRDTLRYTNTGCDSLRRTVNLTVQTATATSANAVICAGQPYTLPWGTVVNTTGIYRDTLRYTVTGCDSVRRTVSLLVQAVNTSAFNPTICAGKTYTLPWGVIVNTAGIYKDTLRYRNTNCDSLIRVVTLAVTPAALFVTTASICAGETYTLPWGTIVSNTGIYRDTVRTQFGCDSLVRAVTLSVKPVPSLSLTKSNDINCVIGIANLAATGGFNYVWWPASSLSDSVISNPVASPNITTVYHVKATNAVGCIKEDSIIVRVNKNDVANGFLLPTAFTPNGDGLNDCFGVRSWGNVTNLKLEIYDRWGRLIFVTTNPTQCWDGTDKTVKLPSGAFIYQVAADTNCGRVFRKGTVMLVR